MAEGVTILASQAFASPATGLAETIIICVVVAPLAAWLLAQRSKSAAPDEGVKPGDVSRLEWILVWASTGAPLGAVYFVTARMSDLEITGAHAVAGMALIGVGVCALCARRIIFGRWR